MSRYTEIRGCIHIHFPLRKLENNIEVLGEYGNIAGIDFLIVNSHTPEKNISRYKKTFQKEGYYGKTLVLTGEETDDKKQMTVKNRTTYLS